MTGGSTATARCWPWSSAAPWPCCARRSSRSSRLAYARFLVEWQGVGSGSRGADAVLAVIEQLAGYALPASAVESVILPARVTDYTPGACWTS